MRIAQVAPLFESVPPRLYGGTERVVHYLTEELVAAGHDVTLFASGDSRTSAKLVSPTVEALRLGAQPDRDPLAAWSLMNEQLAQRAERGEFDLIHLHTDHLAWSLVRRLNVPHVTTLHGRLDLRDLPAVFAEFVDMPLVSISDSQRRPALNANWRATVHHGLPEDLLLPGTGSGGYLAYLGRISPEKGPARAIAIAERARVPLKIAAKVSRDDREYFRTEIEPLFDSPYVEFLGEIGEREKGAFLGQAAALLFPIEWPEPFGLAMIEALACGTPVIAHHQGSVPEVLRHGITGFIADDLDEAVQAVENLGLISREECRAQFEQRFTARRMMEDYVEVYEGLLREARPGVARLSALALE